MVEIARRGWLHWVAMFLAVANTAYFVYLNYRGILEWKGVGVYTIPAFALGAAVSSACWFIARLRSRSGLSMLFWAVLFIPLVLMLLLPVAFFV